MRLLYIVSVWPEPLTSGASTRVMQLLEAFRKANYEITVASTASPTEQSADLTKLGFQVAQILLNDGSFDQFITKLQPQMVVFDKFISEEQFGWRVAEQLPDALRILDTIDLHCLRAARTEQCKKEAQQLELQNVISLREIAAIYRCDISLFVGDYEIDLVVKHFQVSKHLLHYHPLTIKYDPTAQFKTFHERQDFIAIGTFLHPPNWDAVLQLKQHLWPLIRKRLPDAKLNIVGSYPPAKAKSLHAPKEGFCILGFVEDDFQVMQQARVHLAPLRFGAGIKSKCVLALRAGTPTVTTKIGAEGLMPNATWAGDVCQITPAFVDAAVRLYTDQHQFDRAQQQAIEILPAFDAQKWQSPLLDRLAEVQRTLKQHRRANFTGQLLLHHQQLSTRYLSKWIEAKNRP